MALFKLTWAFSGPDHGASESWYFQRSTQDVQAAFTFIDDLKDKRKKLLGNGWSMKAQRVAMLRTNAGAKVTRATKLSKLYLTSGLDRPAEETNMSLQVLCADSTQQYKKLQFLCGPWQAIFPAADSYVPTAGGWSSYFNQYAASLIAHECGWLHAATTQAAVVSGYEFDASTGHTMMTLTAPGMEWNVGEPIRVSVEFPLSKNPLDGSYLVVPLSATTAVTAKPRPAPPFTVPGTMRILGGEFINLATTNSAGATGTVEGQNPVSRKRGRPLYVSRGRQSPRPVW